MRYPSLDAIRQGGAGVPGKGPVAVLIAEDGVELESSLAHLLRIGFGHVVLVMPEGMALPATAQAAETAGRLDVVTHATRRPNAATDAVNAVIDRAAGRWLHYCFNGEYLFFPFCESRSIQEAVTFAEEERRASILTYVVDLYAPDLTAHPNAVDLATAHLDASGYYAETRTDAAGAVKDRQLDFFGGLRWRFEEHVAPDRRKIDRVGLFRAERGLRLGPDHTLNDEERNTYACPWHHSMTAAICSFRVAKALRTNPGSRHDVPSFMWHRSTPFDWSSEQLMHLGLMEPGQWF